MKRIDYIKIIASFIGIQWVVISFLKVLWIGEKIDTYIFSYIFGVAKYWIYLLLGLLCVFTIIKQENKIKKKNFIIGSAILTIGIIAVIANITANNFGFKIRGIKDAYEEFSNGFSNYLKTSDVVWFDKSIQGGIIGNFLSGILGYASIVVSLIVYSLIALIGISLILWGTYYEIYKKIWKHSGLKKISWKKIKGHGIKKLFFGKEEKGIIPLDEISNEDISSHSKINELDKNTYIELNTSEYQEDPIEDEELEVTLFEELLDTHLETYKPKKENYLSSEEKQEKTEENDFINLPPEDNLNKKENLNMEFDETQIDKSGRDKKANKNKRNIISPYGDVDE